MRSWKRIAAHRVILEEHDCWYRWSLVSASDDMADIILLLRGHLWPGAKVHHSGRYRNIFVNEVSADKIVTI